MTENCEQGEHMVRYEIIEHTADIGIIARGASLDELFENAAYGMFDLMFDLGTVESVTTVEVTIAGDEPAELLYRWLSELLYRFETEDMVWCSFSVTIGDGLSAVVRGAGIEAAELRGAPIKAVTRHNLTLQHHGREWTSTVLFDI